MDEISLYPDKQVEEASSLPQESSKNLKNYLPSSKVGNKSLPSSYAAIVSGTCTCDIQATVSNSATNKQQMSLVSGFTPLRENKFNSHLWC